EQGLLTTAGSRALSCALPWGLCVGIIALVGLPRLVLGLQNNRPSGFLIVSLAATFIVTSVALGRPVRRTRRPGGARANLATRHGRLRTLRNEPDSADAALAVALFGGTVLAGTMYATMYDRVRKYDASGSGGGCSTATGCGGGGSGCGGG